MSSLPLEGVFLQMAWAISLQRAILAEQESLRVEPAEAAEKAGSRYQQQLSTLRAPRPAACCHRQLQQIDHDY